MAAGGALASSKQLPATSSELRCQVPQWLLLGYRLQSHGGCGSGLSRRAATCLVQPASYATPATAPRQFTAVPGSPKAEPLRKRGFLFGPFILLTVSRPIYLVFPQNP